MNQPRRKNHWLPVTSWCFYDFANSAFVTLVITFVYSAYFTKSIAPSEVEGTRIWSLGLTITGIIAAVLSPIMGAMADRGGYRKVFLIGWTLLCVAATTLLYFVLPGQPWLAIGIFIAANLGYQMSQVFYNAYLPEIAQPHTIGRISGYGWAWGYVGGLLAMFIVLITLVYSVPPWFGFSIEQGENIRASNLLVALWFFVFSLPMFFFVHEPRTYAPIKFGPLIRDSFGQLASTFREIRRYKHTARFLVARLIYNDGLITVYAFGGIYSQGTFGFTFQELMIFGIVLNITAGVGAFALGFLDDWLGGKRTIMISLIGLIAAALLAVFSPNKTLYWVAGVLVGIFGGPNQSASRSLLGRLTPPEKENEFYGFFAFSGKATAFLGPFFVGQLTDIFNSQRAGMAVVLVFFIAGMLLLIGVKEAGKE